MNGYLELWSGLVQTGFLFGAQAGLALATVFLPQPLR